MQTIRDKMHVVCLIIGAATVCHAQFSSNVQGTISDPGGRVVAGATVTLINIETNVKSTATSNRSGNYRFASVLPGDYKISIESPGFQESIVKRHIGTDETAGINVTLTVGSADLTIEVTTAETGLNADETRLEYTLSSQDLNQLPLPDRSTISALRLTPGVVGTIETTGNTNTNIPIGQASPDARSNGRPASSNVYLLDRIPITSTQNTGSLNMVPNPDMLSEIALQTITYSVENGATSSIQVDLTSKAGGNKLHGDVDFSYTSKPFEANPDFSSGVAPFHRKYFMASIGGPIIRDHTFFFASIERVDNLTALGAEATAISSAGIGAWAASTFPSVAFTKLFTYSPGGLSNPATSSIADNYYPNPAYDGGTTKGNKFGIECNTPASFMLPCATPVSVQGEFTQDPGITGQQYNLRFDHNFNQANDRIYFGYFGVQQNSAYIDPRPDFNTQTPSQSYFFSAGYSHSFSPVLLNQFNVGLNRFWGGGNTNPNYAIFPHGTLFSFFSDPGGVGFAGGPQEDPDSPYLGNDNKEHVLAVRDYVNWLKGKHNIKVGFQTTVRDYWLNNSALYSRPYNSFYSDLLEMLQGEADETSLYTISATTGKWISQVYGARQLQLGAYAQDDWKVRPNLLMSFGMRWDDFGNPSEYGDHAIPYSNTFLGAGSTLYAQLQGAYAKTVTQAFTSGQTWNFLPRAAFSWAPHAAKDFVVRGGVGLYQDALNLNQITANLPITTPVRLTLTLHDNAEPYGSCFFCGPARWTGNSAIPGEPDSFAFTGTQGNTPPYGIPYPAIAVTGFTSRGLATGPNGLIYQSDMYGVDPHLKPQSTVLWSTGVEKGLPDTIVVGATYGGSYSYNQYFVTKGYNNPPGSALGAGVTGYTAPPWSQVGTISLVRNLLNSNYNALILTARQYTGNLTWQASYSWSHSLGNPGSGDNPNPYNPTASYGTTGLDVHQRITFSGAYRIPAGNSALSNGWSLGGIVIAQDGVPFTVYSSQDVNNDGNKDGSNDLPNVVFEGGSGLHYGKYSNSQFKAGIFNSCGGGPAGSGNLYGASSYPNCPFQTVTVPNPTTLEGNEKYNAFRNPGYWDVDLNLQKRIELPRLGDRKSYLILRLEGLNAFNHANLNGFGGSIMVGSTGQFGQVMSAENPRILQIGGRFEF
jgi:Carboxypeptidase regulatory-like domain